MNAPGMPPRSMPVEPLERVVVTVQHFDASGRQIGQNVIACHIDRDTSRALAPLPREHDAPSAIKYTLHGLLPEVIEQNNRREHFAGRLGHEVASAILKSCRARDPRNGYMPGEDGYVGVIEGGER